MATSRGAVAVCLRPYGEELSVDDCQVPVRSKDARPFPVELFRG